MPKNTQPATHIAEIDKISHDGRGITSLNNKKVFVEGAIPDEKVAFQILKKRSHYYEAIATEIIHASAKRVTEVPCAHFGTCGGCSLQHLTMDYQITFKQETVLAQLKQFGNVTPLELLPALHTESIGYRHKARLGVKFVEKKNKVLVGFRERSSRYLAMLDRCAVLLPAVGERLSDFSELIASLTNFRQIAQIEVAAGDKDVALVFRNLATLSQEDLEKLIVFGKSHQMQIYLQPNKPEPIVKLWPTDENDRLSYSLPDYHLEYLFHPLDFTQINLTMNRKMVTQALNLLALQASDKVLDLFCGIGNFTLPLAKHAHHAVGIEGSEEMVKRGYQNARHNQISNADFYAANLDEPDANASWLKDAYDKILLDPPRVGAQSIIPHLDRLNAERILYVSCNPATLARDAGVLVHEYGYLLKAVGIMNMFPHTAHIETMALFCKK